MSDTSLIFNLLAIDKASEKILGVKGAFGLLAVGAAAAGAKFADTAVHMAAEFESSQLRLVTTAGESQKALNMVNQGVLNMAGPVATGPLELSKALYTVESAGFHAADGLKVLEAATKGAKVEGADAKEVADAVSSALVDYHLSADHATEVTNTLIAAVGHGKTTMQDLSAAMPNVLSAASAAGVSFQEAAAALATMTQHGTDASTAGTYLRQVILGLENPSTKARNEMRSLGLDANSVSMNLGKNGLASTIAMVEDAIKNHLSPAGLVAVNALRSGKSSVTDFQAALANLPQGQKTAIGALADMVGGVKNLQGFLQLGGENLKTFASNTAAVRQQVAAGGKEVDGWSKYQQTYNYKLDSAKASMQALTIQIGTALLPKAKDLMDALKDGVGWLEKHKTTAEALATTMGTLAGAFLLYRGYLMAAKVATDAWKVATAAWTAVTKGAELAVKAWTAAQWLLDAAMDANPIGLIIIAVAALAAGIFYLWTHSKAFREFFIGMWHGILVAAKAVGAWFAGPFAHFFVEVWDGIKKGALAWWHLFTGFWGGVIDFFEKLPGRVLHGLEALPGLIGHAVQSGVDKLLYWFGYGVTKAALFFYVELPQKVWAGLKALWSGAVRLTTEGVNATVDWFSKLPGRAEAEAKKLWQFVTKEFDAGATWAIGTAGKVYYGVVGWFTSTVDDTEKWIKQLPGRVEHWMVDTYQRATRWAGNATNDTISWFEQLPGRAWTAFSNMVGSIWRTVSGAGSWLLNTGHDIIWGLIHGIENAIGDAINAVTHAMGRILQGAKDALGISSPSKVFAAEVGHWIPHGIARGIADAASVAHDAVAGLMGGMVVDAKVNASTAFTGPTGYPTAPATGQPGGAAGGPMVVELRAAPGDQAAEALLAILRPTVRGRYGGSATAALGGAA